MTADELEAYRDREIFLGIALEARVNDEIVGRDLLSNMSWTFEEMVAYASRGTVHGLVANAGITWRARLDELDPATSPASTK